ncbi:circularly permuted type 2 ATP-grasp protein [Lampropedia aestuarii]|uniref:circularly permuted type 2 ATP-grasp protein n=1 Tax=Lampropedia aestuarii TaxID=2562762 RepID=UPI0024690DF1|nr:circularly permuted type 2 ATP-grasp protein [Lampropedia aestuarii]MDH5858635.1 circularly permuted type 2 ATP-grasp protein [Lampropedia aestuarii]
MPMSLFDHVLASEDLADSLVLPLAQPAPPGNFDNLRDRLNPDQLAPHWNTFFAKAIDSLPENVGIADTAHMLTAKFDELQQTMGRNVEDNGVTYNLYSDAVSQSRPWAVDLFPMIVTQADWHSIRAGITQRAELLNCILQDVYGEQQLVRDGLLPSALVHGHAGYFRAAHGIKPAGGTYLHVAAFDLAQGADGQWWVVSQRTQAPSGLGYALENRLIVSKLFQEAFNALHIERLSEAYAAFVRSLRVHSQHGENARIVLLTPGPYSETYFEHIYLARYLGISLVEGGDLVVRDERVWLKTIKGLEPVHVVIRRLDDDYLDPLELRADSALGIPGMLQAWRSGNVVMANAPGTGFLESAAVMGFLPAISTHLLREPLRLPSIASWWLGERTAKDAMLPQLAQHVLKPTFNDQARRFVPAMGQRLKPAELAQWKERINKRPADYAAQAWLPLAHMPTWRSSAAAQAGGGHCAPIGSQAMMIRVYALSNGPGRWRVVPGGLTRIAPPGKEVVSMYRGGSSADLWVMSDREVAELPVKMAYHRTEHVVTSRAAESLFWFGRYTERLDNSVRFARVILEALNNAELDLSGATLDWLHQLACDNGLVSPAAPTPKNARVLFERALVGALPDRRAEHGAWSVATVLDGLQYSAFSVRERLASEQWTLVNQAQQDFYAAMQGNQIKTHQALQALEHLASQSMAMTGAQLDRMTRDDGWRMLSLGRQVERMGTLACVLASALQRGAMDDDAGFALLLECFDSTITYRSRYQQHRDVYALVQLLVLEPENPRSLVWMSETLMGRLKRLPSSPWANVETEDIVRSLPEYWPADELLQWAEQGNVEALAATIGSAAQTAQAISDRLTQQYFVHAHADSQAVGS